MIALGILLVSGIWLAIAYAVSAFSYKLLRRRWVQVAAFVLVLWLPYWDLIPGLIVYRAAVHEWAGLHIYRTVQADGYLSGKCINCDDAWLWMEHSPYKYQEVHVLEPKAYYVLMPKPGYYELRLYPITDARCAVPDLPSDTTRKIADGRFGVTGICVIAKRRDQPISRYLYESSRPGWDPYPAPSWLGPKVKFGWQRVTDLQTGTTIAKAGDVSLTTWIGPWLPFSYWRYSDSRGKKPYDFEITKVIEPSPVAEGSGPE